MDQEIFLIDGDGSIWVDDTSPDIIYASVGSESWQQDFGSTDALGNAASTYNHTSHVIKGDGSLSFTFNGTGLSAMGTVTIRNVRAQNDPSWTCSIDGIEYTARNNGLKDTNRWILCANKSLPLGVHTATINIKSLGTPFYIDYLHYLPAPSVNRESQIFAIDSLNPIILYDSDWTDGPNNSRGHVKQKTGGTLSIQFNGTSISWIGFALQSLPKAPSKGRYSLDFGDPVQFDIPGVGSQSTDVYQQTFFTTPSVENGPHTLSVTYDGDDRTTPLILDYFLISNGPIIPNNTQLISNSPNTGATSSGAGSNTKDAFPVPTNDTISPGSTSPRSSASHTGAIIGGVVGASVVIAIFLAALLVLRKRRRSRSEPATVEPFSVENQMPPSVGAGWVSPGHQSSKPGSHVQSGSISGTAISSGPGSSGATNITTKVHTRIEPPEYAP